jgi:hypothetical protein
MLGVYAAYRATGEAAYLERLGDWADHGRATLPDAADASASLLAALPLVRYRCISSDSNKEPAPAAWKTWWTKRSQQAARSPRLIAGLATVAALGADTPTSSMEVRVEWFRELNQHLAEFLPAMVDPLTGLINNAEPSLSHHDEVLLGLSSILGDLPRRDETWKRWADITRALSTALVKRQGSGGLWAADLGSGAGDVPGSALVVAGLGSLLDQGLIDGATFGPALSPRLGAGFVHRSYAQRPALAHDSARLLL